MIETESRFRIIKIWFSETRLASELKQTVVTTFQIKLAHYFSRLVIISRTVVASQKTVAHMLHKHICPAERHAAAAAGRVFMNICFPLERSV